ncbi:hypothetical protein DQT32_04455 [Salmonella enterica subsp. enterica serovar Braenderup]|nr:hypothetical protein [Salmonella enterica subsp. enterica serovar Braenderup]
MRVQTLIQKLFGKDSIQDYMDTLDADDKESVLEYYTIQRNEDDCEPDYFVKLFSDGLYTIKDINGNVIIHTYDTPALKNKLKVLAANNE